MARRRVEPRVRSDRPMPSGYRFVPKGDLYITGNVRRRTHAAGSTLYVVVGADYKILGLRCPEAILEAVIADERASAEARAAVVRNRDLATERDFKFAMLRLYPHVPRVEIPTILRRTLEKRSRRVGRTGTLDLDEKVQLAVQAHIWHRYTWYDAMLRSGICRQTARFRVSNAINETARRWGWRGLTGRRNRLQKGAYVRPATAGKDEKDGDKDGSCAPRRRGRPPLSATRPAVASTSAKQMDIRSWLLGKPPTT